MFSGLGGRKGRWEKRWAVSGKCPSETFTLHHSSELHEDYSGKTDVGHINRGISCSSVHGLA